MPPALLHPPSVQATKKSSMAYAFIVAPLR
jgi:hypothetical protein